jgi:hypothetical protein
MTVSFTRLFLSPCRRIHRLVIIRSSCAPLPAEVQSFYFWQIGIWGIAKIATVAFCVWTAIILYFFWGSDSLSLSIFMFGDLLLLTGHCGRGSARHHRRLRMAWLPYGTHCSGSGNRNRSLIAMFGR